LLLRRSISNIEAGDRSRAQDTTMITASSISRNHSALAIAFQRGAQPMYYPRL